MNTKRRMTVPEIAEKLGMSKHRVYRRIQRGDIPATIGGPRNSQYFVDAADLDEYMSHATSEDLTWTSRNHAMLRPAEAAAMLGFTVETVRALCTAGKLVHHRGNGKRGHYRISRESVEEYIAGMNR